MAKLVLVGLISLLLTACMPWQTKYLGPNTGKATQEEVKDKFGDPLKVKDAGELGTMWTYHYEVRSSLIHRRGDMIGGNPCVEYDLTFDHRNILTYWTRRPCLVF
jgi:hypothetical protein